MRCTADSCAGPLIRGGDVAVVCAAAALVGLLAGRLWFAGTPQSAVVRLAGHVYAELPLARDAHVGVPGPLGTSTVEVHAGRARVLSDPGPRQYCVRQGWIGRAGESAVCLPNRVSVEIRGGRPAYDSLNY